MTFYDCLNMFAYCIAILVSVAIASPYAIAFLFLFMLVCFKLRQFYIAGSREVRARALSARAATNSEVARACDTASVCVTSDQAH